MEWSEKNKVCECGCGGIIILQKHHKYHPSKFIHGHNSKNIFNIKHGYYSKRSNKKILCKEKNCNNTITYHCFKYGKGRCKSCSKKDTLNPRYKTGKRYCICGKEIACHANRCWGCEVKRRENPKIHFNYKNGASLQKYPKEFHRMRKKILKRDNYKCQYCFQKGNTVHHIDYNKNHNSLYNLITVCPKCNIKANYTNDICTFYWRIAKSNTENKFISMFEFI
jgi:5-methylcytosine-specific restriction endonuclease McrA